MVHVPAMSVLHSIFHSIIIEMTLDTTVSVLPSNGSERYAVLSRAEGIFAVEVDSDPYHPVMHFCLLGPKLNVQRSYC